MSDPWAELDAELTAWGRTGKTATFWLRDDDAIADTAALRRLFDIAQRSDVPVCLAVIPKGAGEDLARAVHDSANAGVIQHGWCHANHAGPEEKKFELGDHRPPDVIGEELARGARRLKTLFGPRYTSVLAPPWNRIGAGVAGNLAGWGYRGLSVFGPRNTTVAAPGLKRVNTHVDIIDWKGSRGFRGTDAAVAQAVAHLKARREGAVDADEPTGLITHHLVHDERCWAFIEAFCRATGRHAHARWLSVFEAFGAEDSGHR